MDRGARPRSWPACLDVWTGRASAADHGVPELKVLAADEHVDRTHGGRRGAGTAAEDSTEWLPPAPTRAAKRFVPQAVVLPLDEDVQPTGPPRSERRM